MRQHRTKAVHRHRSPGFSLVELLIVWGIIGAMAAVALPSVARYVRNFRIKGATQQVAMEINVARSKAIMKNVNLGVLFAVVSPTQYRWVVEDDQIPNSGTATDWFGYGGEDWTRPDGDARALAGRDGPEPPDQRGVRHSCELQPDRGNGYLGRALHAARLEL